MSKVESIVDPSFKTGQGGKGPWTLVKILADGKTASGFGPVSVGDEVSLEYNDQYHNWGFKKLGPQDIPTIQVETPPEGSTKLLELIYDDTQRILKLLDKTAPSSLKENWDKVAPRDNVTEDIGEEPMDISAIPF